MGLQKITFDGANVTSKMDADLYHFLFSKTVGILNGLKGSVNYSLSNNTITFQDGYIAIYGRLIYIESGTSVYVSPDSSKYGYVIVSVDTITNSLSIYIRESIGTYPTLTTDNLNNADGVYELPICAYSKTTTSVTINSSYQRKLIETNNVLIEKAKSDLTTSFTSQRRVLTKVSNGVYKFNISYMEIENTLISLVIGYNTVLNIPGHIIFEEVGSTASVNYSYGSGQYALFLSYSNDYVTLTCGDTSHVITSLYTYK